MTESRSGRREIRAALAESRRLFLSCGFFSMFVNLLMLTGPLFMLQVYDRVLISRSEATLVTLVAITAFLFLMMGVLDYARGRWTTQHPYQGLAIQSLVAGEDAATGSTGINVYALAVGFTGRVLGQRAYLP